MMAPLYPVSPYGGIKPTAVESKTTDYLDFSTAKGHYNRLIDAWGEINTTTDRNRALRYHKAADSKALRDQGILKADEMYNPLRIIDTNIRREQPQFINYLTQSRRSIIFAPETEETVDGLEKLEADFTKKARYLGWEIPFIRAIDGAQTHGWDSVELIYDPNYPGNFCFHHVGHGNLIFALDCEDINFQELILRKERLTSSQLENFVATKGWNKSEVDNLIENSRKDSVAGAEVNCDIYKVFFKRDGVIMTSWMSPSCNEYFVEPRPLFLGVRDTEQQPVDNGYGEQDYPKVEETEYPFTIFKYIESEDPYITNLVGRVNLDESVQEGASAMSSGLINGILRASNIYASPRANNLNQNPNAAPSVLPVVLRSGSIYDQPLDFWHLPYPDPSVIQAIQAVVTQNQQEQSQVNFSVLNRKDSGKTATEVQAATSKASELSSVQIILISIFIRQAYAKAWRVYQSRVLQQKIRVSQILLPLFGDFTENPIMGPPTIDPNTFMQIPGPQIDSYVTAVPKSYIIKSSGDVDVVQRAENLNRKMQAWPVLANTTIAQEFLKDILRLAFPEDAARYIAAMEQAQMSAENQLKTMLAQVSNVLRVITTDPQTGQVKPEYAAQAQELERLAANVQGVLAQQQGQPQLPAPQQQSNQPQQ